MHNLNQITIVLGLSICLPSPLLAKDFPKSCKEIKELDSSSASGTYTIDPDGIGKNKPFAAYCDMESDEVGLTFYLVNNGLATQKVMDNDSCQTRGLKLFAPRTQEDYERARKYLLSINAPQSFGPLGVYHPTYHRDDWAEFGGWTSFTPMNSKQAGHQFGWTSTAGDTWWISDSDYIFEPNGDYHKGCWLDISYDDAGKVSWYNDKQCNFSYHTYLCMSEDNYAPPSPLSDPSPSSACQLYAVQDDNLNDSQFFSINPDTLEIKPLGKRYPGYDIEALDAHPDTGEIYAAAGDDSNRPGYLYQLNSQTGGLTEIGHTGFAEIESLSFHADGTLWGWAKGDGLISIDAHTGNSHLEFPSAIAIEGLTWNNDSTQIYAAQNTTLWVYDGKNVKKACDLPGHTEALEMLPNNTLLVGIHGQEKLLDFQIIDLVTCNLVMDIGIPTAYDDVEGIAWACATQ